MAIQKSNNNSNSGSIALTDYQVLITLNTQTLISQGKMRSDCGDIRFALANGTLISYWIESGCNTNNTLIWVKVPSIPANSNTTIYLYYGNPSATSLSNPYSTMELFDDFEDGVINTTIWNVTSGVTETDGYMRLPSGADNYAYTRRRFNVSSSLGIRIYIGLLCRSCHYLDTYFWNFDITNSSRLCF